jgi:hypothetical protein
MRHLFVVAIAALFCMPLMAGPSNTLDSRNWPGALAECWQFQPTRQAIFYLEQPYQPGETWMPEVQVAKEERKPPPAMSVLASTHTGIVFLVAGVLGWIVLALSVFILGRRPTCPLTS